MVELEQEVKGEGADFYDTFMSDVHETSFNLGRVAEIAALLRAAIDGGRNQQRWVALDERLAALLASDASCREHPAASRLHSYLSENRDSYVDGT